MRPEAKGRSLTAVSLLHGDPAGQPGYAAASRWPLEAWRYAAHEPDVLSTPYLVNAFYTARPDALAATWRTAKGPIAAAHLALTRLGCYWPAPFEIADHEGSVYNMFHVLPKTMRHLLHRATLDRLAEQLAGSPPPPHPPTRRVLDEPLRKLLRSSSLTPQQRGIVATVFCGGV